MCFSVQLAAMARWGFWLVSSGVVRCCPGWFGVWRDSVVLYDGYRLVHMACIAVAVMVSRGVSSWLVEVLPRVFVYLVLCVICGAFRIMVVLSTPHCVSIAGLTANPPAFDGVEVYSIKLSSKKKNAPQRLYEPL